MMLRKLATLISFVILSTISAAAYAEESFQPIMPDSSDFGERPAFPILKLKQGDQIIDFECKDIVGNVIKSATVRKDKILILRFVQFNLEQQLNPKEPPNARVFPVDQVRVVSEVAAENLDKVAIIDILVNDKSDKKQLIEKYEEVKASFYLVDDPEGKTMQIFGVKDLPKMLFFDRSGKLVKAGNSLMQRDHLALIVQEMIEKQTKEDKEKAEKK